MYDERNSKKEQGKSKRMRYKLREERLTYSPA